MVIERHTEYFWLMAQGDPGSSQLDVGVEQGLVSVRREKGGMGLGEGDGEALVAGPIFDTSGMPRQAVRDVRATLCNEVEAVKSSAYKVMQSAAVEWLAT